MDTYLACGLCDYRRDMQQPEDIHRYETDKLLMIEHYKFDHPERFGTKTITQPGVAFSDRWTFRPISDEIGPVLHYDGEAYPWSQV